MSLVVQSGSKQYTLEIGQKFFVDRLEAEVDSVIDLDLIYSFGLDSDLKSVKAKVLRHLKGEKIRVVKFKSKSNYHRQYGHRSYLTELQVEGTFAKMEKPESTKIEKDVIKAEVKKPAAKAKKVESADSETKTEKPVKKAASKTPKTK
jgi:large subunit ribosomal protein L21